MLDLDVFVSEYNNEHLIQHIDATLREDSSLETVRKDVSNHQQQIVEEKANVVQSNMSPSVFSSPI
jgi:hypothetical protein